MSAGKINFGKIPNLIPIWRPKKPILLNIKIKPCDLPAKAITMAPNPEIIETPANISEDSEMTVLSERMSQVMTDINSNDIDLDQKFEILKVTNAMEEMRNALLHHDLYGKVNSIPKVKKMMECHVFCVWDFMSLLKKLQREFTSCHEFLWTPKGSSEVRFMINSIVLGEECDVDEQGNILSHFEMHLNAMNQVNANSLPIMNLVHDIKMMHKTGGFQAFKGLQDLEKMKSFARLPQAIKNFVNLTLSYVFDPEPYKAVAAFTFGREDLISPMFLSVLKDLNVDRKEVSKLFYYLERHVEVDGDDHGPLSMKMLAKVCGHDAKKWETVRKIAIEVIQSRYELWSYISGELDKLD